MPLLEDGTHVDQGVGVGVRRVSGIVEVVVDGAYATAVLPAPGVWQLVVVDPAGGAR